jgi:Tfp pilus assembly protein PilW
MSRDQYSSLEDNGRIALETITNVLAHTGYELNPVERFILTSTTVASKSCDSQQSVLDPSLLNAHPTAENAAGDTLGVVYAGDSTIFTDCTGRTLPAGCQIETTKDRVISSIYSSFYLDTTDSTLKCVGSRDTVEHTIAEGVENIQFLYGIDIDPLEEGSDHAVDRYVNASDVSNWGQVISIQVAILVRSLKEVEDKAESKTYTLLNTPVTTATDRYQRAVFSTTVHLRN